MKVLENTMILIINETEIVQNINFSHYMSRLISHYLLIYVQPVDFLGAYTLAPPKASISFLTHNIAYLFGDSRKIGFVPIVSQSLYN